MVTCLHTTLHNANQNQPKSSFQTKPIETNHNTRTNLLISAKYFVVYLHYNIIFKQLQFWVGYWLVSSLNPCSKSAAKSYQHGFSQKQGIHLQHGLLEPTYLYVCIHIRTYKQHVLSWWQMDSHGVLGSRYMGACCFCKIPLCKQLFCLSPGKIHACTAGFCKILSNQLTVLYFQEGPTCLRFLYICILLCIVGRKADIHGCKRCRVWCIIWTRLVAIVFRVLL